MDKFKDTTWEAREYVPHDKNMGWYVALVIVGLALIALGIWVGGWSFSLLIVVSVVALIVYSVRPPRVMKYSFTTKGLKEGNKLYDFSEYKSFGVINDGGHYAIVLTPRKRFAPRVWVYFPEESGEKIVDAFGAKLPMDQVKLDVVDKIVRALRI